MLVILIPHYKRMDNFRIMNINIFYYMQCMESRVHERE